MGGTPGLESKSQSPKMPPAPELHSQIDAEKHEDFDKHGHDTPE